MQDESGNTPLHIAINHLPYSPEIVCLLASSTNVNLKNSTGLTPFHQLLEQADLWQGLYTSTVDNFLTLGADQQLDFPSGKTPLWVYLFNCATLRQHLNDSMFQVIKKFLKQDNSLRSWLLYRERVLEWALEFDDPSVSDYVFSIARRLCDTVDINQCTTNRLYPLHQAIRRLDESAKFEVCIGILLDRAADPNGLDDRCLSPLQVLFHLKKEDDAIVSVTKTLLEFGADPMRGLDSSKWTILLANHNLPLRICRLTIRLLLNASFDQITRSGITLPLYYGWQSRWLGNWVKACESISNWHDIRRCLEAAPEILGPHVGELSSVLFDVGVELLAGKCVETANAYIETGEDKDLEELRRRRNGVALALGDCRKLGIAIEDAWYECLLKLCEIIAERELGF
ncbi:hypothetical protein MMC30_004987 [Trapelia coarctata]|nr:hypothetical protein [Trapelia coarctata]